MKRYYRLMLGRKSALAEPCFAQHFIGVDFGFAGDLTHDLPSDSRDFNKTYVPAYLNKFPHKSKVVAGLACAAVWNVSKGMQEGDVVLCPDGKGNYRIATIAGDYNFAPDGPLPHRRPVVWRANTIARAEMSEGLKNSTGAIGTISEITKHSAEIETLLGSITTTIPVSADDEIIEDKMSFALELHLEDFLIRNWQQTELGKEFDIYEDEGEKVGQQYKVDTGAIDILAISKSKNKLLVVELKKGRASDAVVGQILRYMGYVQDELAENNQIVCGAIIAQDDDQRIRRALSMVPNIDFYRYEVTFKLSKSSTIAK